MNNAYIQADLLQTVSPKVQSELTETSNVQALPQTAEANVTEIIIAKSKADSVQMLLPMLTRLNQEKRWLAWIDPPIELLKRWKQERQDGLEEIMILRSSEKADATNLCEKALAAGTCHAVILWTEGLTNEAFKKLEDASIVGDSHGIVLRSR